MQRFNPEELDPGYKEFVQEQRKIRRKANIREGVFAAAALAGAGLVAGYLNSCEPTESSTQQSAVVASSAPEVVTSTTERIIISYDNPTKSAQYWAQGGSDSEVTVSDINIAKTYVDMVEDPGEASVVKDVLSLQASLAAEYAASGNGNGSITVNDFKVAEYLADVSTEYGDYGDSAYKAIAESAITVGNYWQQGGVDGVVNDRDYQVANYYYDIAAQANQAVLAD